MNLQKKTLLFSLIFFTAASILAGIAIKNQLYDPFIRAEHEDVFQSSEAAKTLFLQNLEDFSQSFADWSSWDDAYDFVNDLNPEFIKSNLNDESFVNLHLNLSAFTDSSGKIKFIKMYDLMENKPIEPNAEEISRILLSQELVQKVINERKHVSGTVLFDQHPAMVIMRPILTSKNEGPARGILIMGRIITEGETVRISKQLGFDLHFDLLKYPDGHPDFLEVRDGLLEKTAADPKAVVVMHSGTNQLCGYSILNDIHGDPLMILRVNQQRETYRQYLISLFYFIGLIILFAIGGISTSLWALHRFILLRLTKLSDQVNRITRMENLSEMIVPGKGNDEIVFLARNINKMLTRIQNGIDEKQELQTRMVQSQKMAAVGQMAAGIAHEINNPISVIKGYAELGLNGGMPNEKPEKIYEIILNRAVRCAQIVRDLLTFSRMGKNEKENADINQVVDEALSFVGPRFTVDNTELIKNYAAGIPAIGLFKNRFQQVIVNLCNNAIDAMGRNGKIYITTSESFLDGQRGVEISVRDTGSGMPPEVLEKIFAPFFTTKEVGKGTGLGLALVSEIVEQHQGRVKVESKVGEGTTFRIFIPV